MNRDYSHGDREFVEYDKRQAEKKLKKMIENLELSCTILKNTCFNFEIKFSGLLFEAGYDGDKEWETFDGIICMRSTKSDNPDLYWYGDCIVTDYTEINGSNFGEIKVYDYRYSDSEYDQNYNFLRDQIIEVVMTEVNKYITKQDFFQAMLTLDLELTDKSLQEQQERVEKLLDRISTLKRYT